MSIPQAITSSFLESKYHCHNSQTPVIYDCRLRPIDIHVVTGTKDLQTVTISLRILQQPIAEHLPTIHQLLGRDYEKKVFNSIGQEVLRTIVAQCNFSLNSRRCWSVVKIQIKY